MCGRVRLSSDYSEIKIRLMFDAAAPAAVLAIGGAEVVLIARVSGCR
jgi:hypothetical protein